MGLQKKINDRKWRAREQPLQPGSECFVTEFLINTPPPPEECCYHTHLLTYHLLPALTPYFPPSGSVFPRPQPPDHQRIKWEWSRTPSESFRRRMHWLQAYRLLCVCVFGLIHKPTWNRKSELVLRVWRKARQLEAYPEFQIDPTPINRKGLS